MHTCASRTLTAFFNMSNFFLSMELACSSCCAVDWTASNCLSSLLHVFVRAMGYVMWLTHVIVRKRPDHCKKVILSQDSIDT